MKKAKKNIISIPVLAYHEVLLVSERVKMNQVMGANCYLSANNFNKQMTWLQQHDYKCSCLNEIACYESNNKFLNENSINTQYIIVTFDDGHIGNYLYAYPILKKLNQKAIFFVTLKNIGKKNMMTWSQLKEMAQNGMSIQSHGVTHKPLETLTEKQVEYEFGESKKILESRLEKDINSFSLPHGSNHPAVLEVAEKTGYKFLYGSTIGYFLFRERMNITIVNRIPVYDTLKINNFINIIKQNDNSVRCLRNKQVVRMALRNLIGINKYRRIYRLYYGIKNYSENIEK